MKFHQIQTGQPFQSHYATTIRLGYSSCSLHGFKVQAHLVNTLDPVQVAVALITLHAVQRRSNSIPKISCFVSFFVARSTVAI